MSFTKNLFNYLKNDTTSEFFENARRALIMCVRKYNIKHEERKFLRKMESDAAEKKLLANQVPTTHDVLVTVWESIAPFLRKCGGIVAGGFVSSFIKWSDNKVPDDIDVWLPAGVTLQGCPHGWRYSRSYNTGAKMPLNIKRICEYIHDEYRLKIQFIFTCEANPFNIIENFDFDVCKGVMSPGLDSNGNIIGIRATKPDIYKAIISNTATFCEREWDIDDGLPNKKCLNRFIKYGKKGYKLAVHKDSKFSIELIAQMAQKLKEEGEITTKSSYECDDEASYITLSNKVNLGDVRTHIRVDIDGVPHYINSYECPSVIMEDPVKYEPSQELDTYYLALLIHLYEQRAKKFKVSTKLHMTHTQLSEIMNKKHNKENMRIASSYINQVNLDDVDTDAPPALYRPLKRKSKYVKRAKRAGDESWEEVE